MDDKLDFYSDLFNAIKFDDLNGVKNLVENKNDIDYDFQFSKRMAPITLAIKCVSNYDLIEFLVDSGFNVNIPKLYSPLLLALRKRDKRLVSIISKSSKFTLNFNLIALVVKTKNGDLLDSLKDCNVIFGSHTSEILRIAIVSKKLPFLKSLLTRTTFSMEEYVHIGSKFEDGCYEFKRYYCPGPFHDLTKTFCIVGYEALETPLIPMNEIIDLIITIHNKLRFQSRPCNGALVLHDILHVYNRGTSTIWNVLFKRLLDYFRSNQIDCDLNFEYQCGNYYRCRHYPLLRLRGSCCFRRLSLATCAVRNGFEDILELLLKSGCDVNTIDINSMGRFDFFKNKERIVRLMVNKGFRFPRNFDVNDIDCSDYLGYQVDYYYTDRLQRVYDYYKKLMENVMSLQQLSRIAFLNRYGVNLHKMQNIPEKILNYLYLQDIE